MRYFLICLAVLGLPLAAQAQSAPALRDPTRPPDWQGSATEAEGGEQVLRLEAVKRVRQGRSLATINGVTLHVGQEIRGLRLVSIAEWGVVLEGPEGRQTLRLTPDVALPLKGSPAGGKGR